MMPTRKYNNQNWLPSIFNDFFDNEWLTRANATAPAINVIESDKDYKVEVAAPGMTKEDFNIHMKLQSVFIDHNTGIKRSGQESFQLRQPFQFTYRNIIALINSFRGKNGFNRFYYGWFPDINTQGQCLNDKIIVEFVDDQLR